MLLLLLLFYSTFCVTPVGTKYKFTFIHTNDSFSMFNFFLYFLVHGWINGHRHDSTLDADIADYYCFLFFSI
jgi:nitric oxide reductase large subunit